MGEIVMRILYDDGLCMGKVLSSEEIAEKELKESPPNVQKLLLKIRQINRDNKKFWNNKKEENKNEP
jgi:hypothetical protein